MCTCYPSTTEQTYCRLAYISENAIHLAHHNATGVLPQLVRYKKIKNDWTYTAAARIVKDNKYTLRRCGQLLLSRQQ